MTQRVVTISARPEGADREGTDSQRVEPALRERAGNDSRNPDNKE